MLVFTSRGEKTYEGYDFVFRRRDSKESGFLDLETVIQPVCQLRTVFDEDPDYVTDLSFLRNKM